MQSRYSFVSESNIHTLYHYERFNADYLERILVDQRIHCSNPAKLNDPWDCKVWFDERPFEDSAQLNKLLPFLHQVALGPAPPSVVANFDIMMRTNQAFRREFLRGLSEQATRTVCNRRIYCLTPDPRSILMWSHYANDHKGICLEFGTDNELFKYAHKVEYLINYPTWSPHEPTLENVLGS